MANYSNFNFNQTGIGAGGAAADLGLLGGQLRDQVEGETEEERRKRIAALRSRGYGGMSDPANPGLGAASALGLSMGFGGMR